MDLIPELLTLLREMGAVNVDFIDEDGKDAVLMFEYGGKNVVLESNPYNDGKAGFIVSIKTSSGG